MCYDVKALLESQLKRAERRGDRGAIEEIKEQLAPYTNLPLFHVSGFSHPDLLIYTNRSPYFPEVATWGLIPHWVKDEDQKLSIWNRTLNARVETIFEKPAFRDVAENNRCIIYIDGFYEHHHYKGKTYPFYIYRKDGEPLALAGLYSYWRYLDGIGGIMSFTIVTTEGQGLVKTIHNNPKLKGPRMPIILNEANENIWLEDANSKNDKLEIINIIKPNQDIELICHTVRRLRGKSYPGNVEGINEEVVYDELIFNN